MYHGPTMPFSALSEALVDWPVRPILATGEDITDFGCVPTSLMLFPMMKRGHARANCEPWNARWLSS